MHATPSRNRCCYQRSPIQQKACTCILRDAMARHRRHTAPRARRARGDCPVASPVGASRPAVAMRYEWLFQGPLPSRRGGLRTRRSDARLILIVVTPLTGIPILPSPNTRMLHSRDPAVSGFLIADSTAGARLSPRLVGGGPAIRLMPKTLVPNHRLSTRASWRAKLSSISSSR